VISKRYFNLGDRIDPARPLFNIVDDSKLLLNIWVNEADKRNLEIGEKADIYDNNSLNIIGQARLIRISPVVDPTYGKIKATYEIVNKTGNLMPGQFVELHIILETHRNVLLLPKHAMIYEAGIPVVFVFKDSLALRKPLKLSLQSGDNVEVLSGVIEGESIIVDGHTTLKDSALVKTVSTSH